MQVQISFKAEIDDSYFGELSRIVDHHLEYLVDLAGNPEIKNLSDGELEDLD